MRSRCGQRDGKPVAAAAARRRGRHRGGARRSPAEDGYPLVALGIPKQKQKGHFPIPLYWSSVGRASRTLSPPPSPATAVDHRQADDSRSDRWRLPARLREPVGFEQCLLKRAPKSRLGAPGVLNAYDSSARPRCPSGRRPGSEPDLCVRFRGGREGWFAVEGGKAWGGGQRDLRTRVRVALRGGRTRVEGAWWERWGGRGVAAAGLGSCAMGRVSV